ncbi:MAG: sugar ABC transporter ATP-binding protein [Chloroflexi bacterium]|nr:MAG: sugar ABC transporter ATP-binding protein [Chloroflexota bacterium]
MKLPSPPAPAERQIVLELQHISKQYGTVQALSDVGLDCRAGEIHAVVGENGSGKSTLLGIASGFVEPDQGVILIGGRRLRKDSPAGARRLGLGMAYQDNSQVLALSVKENLYLATPPRHRPPYWQMKKWATQALAAYELDLFPDAPTGHLTLAQRQLFEVVKALLGDPKVLLLDEPTTALGPDEVDLLHRTIRACAESGVGVVYVSHRLPEVLTVANRITVLRDGRSQGTYIASEMSEASLVSLMIGRPFQVAFPPALEDPIKSSSLLMISGFQGPLFGPINLTVKKGEIVGIAGAEGNGQSEFFKCLSGQIPPKAGLVICDGNELTLISPVDALKAGILLLAGDRKHESLFPVLGVRNNATIQVLGKFSSLGFVNRGRERKTVKEMIHRLQVRTPSVEQPVQFLSGGNQQKVSLMRPHLRETVKVILAYEPTQGVDAGARFDIYEALRAKAAEGAAVIVKSSDPIELSGLCDRVVVMSRGQIVNEIERADLSEKRIVESIVGGVGFGLKARRPVPVGPRAATNLNKRGD